MIDGNKSQWMGTSKIDRQRDVRLRIVFYGRPKKMSTRHCSLFMGQFGEIVNRLIWATASSNTPGNCRREFQIKVAIVVWR